MDTLKFEVTPRSSPPPALYVKHRPAEIVRRERATTEVLAAGHYQRQVLVAQAVRMQRRGEIKILRREIWDADRGEWTMVVRRIKPAPPAWRKPVMVGSLVAVLVGAVIGAIWWALATLAAIPGAIALSLVGLGFLAWVGSRHARPRGGVDVNVRVRVR